MGNNFVDIPFTTQNLDRYGIRTAILKSLTDSLPKFGQSLLDVGCGKMPYKAFIIANSRVNTYIGLDIETAIVYDSKVKPDITWDGKKMPVEAESFETVMATEVLEHCPDPERVLTEIYRVLKPGGSFFFTVPFLWNLHEVPYDAYRYTPFILEKLLVQSGFTSVEINAHGGWHASLAQMLGLWVRRAPMRSIKRKVLSHLFKPLIKYLYKKDHQQVIRFKEGQMITGLSGLAFKA